MAGQTAITADPWEAPDFLLHAASKLSQSLVSENNSNLPLHLIRRPPHVLTTYLLTLTYHTFVISGAILPQPFKTEKASRKFYFVCFAKKREKLKKTDFESCPLDLAECV